MALTSPAQLGGGNFRLATVTYCIYSVAVGSKVDRIEVWADPPATALAWDDTDRTTSGCFLLNVPTTTGVQPAYTLYLLSSGGGSIGLATVTTQWILGGPTPGSIDNGSQTDEAGGPNTP